MTSGEVDCGAVNGAVRESADATAFCAMSRTKFKVAPPPEQDDGSDSDDDLGVEVYELSANLDAEEPALPSFARERCMPEPWMEYSAPKEREAFRARQRVAMGQASTVRPEREPPKGDNLARVFPNYGHAETKRAEYRAERESLDFILSLIHI